MTVTNATWGEGLLTQEVRQDHNRLKRTIELVESTLQMGTVALPMLRGFCFSLVTLLEQHEQREASWWDRPEAAQSEAYGDAAYHRQETLQLRLILRHLLVDAVVPFGELREALVAVLRRLQDQLTVEDELIAQAGGHPRISRFAVHTVS